MEGEAVLGQRPRQSRDGRRDPPGQAEILIPRGRRDGDRRFQRESRCGGVRQARFLCGAGYFLQRHVPLRRCGSPGRPQPEKEGTFTSTERRIQRLHQVFEPIPGSRPDWKITQDIANRLGANWNYAHPSEIMSEMASLAPLLAGVNYERIEGYKSLKWPVAADGSDQPLLSTKKF